MNLELQEAKGLQEEQGAQTQRLKDKLAQMKDTLGQAQQRLVSGAPRQQEVKFQGLIVEVWKKTWLKTNNPVLSPSAVWGGGSLVTTFLVHSDSLGALISISPFF